MSTPADFRLLCRREEFTSHTSGILPSYMQANLLILPGAIAKDFEDLCHRNPVPCPLLAKTERSFDKLDNVSLITHSDHGFDIRTDIPKYHIFQGGRLQEKSNDCRMYWRDNYVGFLIGCSYSFEGSLISAGLPPKNAVLGQNVSMYKTTKYMDASGIFARCPYVVSMRPYKEKDLDAVRSITSEYKLTHGGPIDWGFDGAIRLGISDLSKPEYGDAIDIEDDEIPVFWGCGVTPHLAIETVGHLIEEPVITHAPGCMLLLDTTYKQFSES
ncbi:ZYRO0C00308p [Zygosaccharomyces rouxii]|uniref:ZYRO0C00308p n=1 Tax=Zygosaccharomyces rouxii (strain ATCC 2623 / CBS 732 / NBRC 1130 / NCYC 568 / NRRL Y-229) TaxID=559307 RepID=C5DSI1_ZYGRC|nr:uncharacterized protein ZYRO0C00308g [Zygosaccharomyces rouxii]KAH9202070.1 hypothetical protein LQ764DRAFT_208801 [Zygosaccharomyces rouxii]CAR26742.1 ZYRO0C00308p [Zygosaccharomyces rouxii]